MLVYTMPKKNPKGVQGKDRKQGTQYATHKGTIMQEEGRVNEDQVRLIRVRQRSQREKITDSSVK